jgi:hypothetical protein
MVSRDPEDPGEPLGKRAKTPLDVCHQLTDVAGQDQPVIVMAGMK